MDLQDLLAERDIQRGLVAFARAMDEREWAALDAVTTADLTADLGMGVIQGRDAVVAFMRSFLDDCGPTQHLLGNIVVEVDGDRATSSAYVADLHLGSDDGSGETFRTLGEYRDEWVRDDDTWRIRHRVKVSRGVVGSFDVLGPGPSGDA